MSFDALAWAAKQKPGNLAAKMVLLALANYANEAGEAYPSTAAIAEFGDMNHKTATVALDRLEAMGLISDTGRKQGKSGQIKVYRLALKSHPKAEASQNREPPKFSAKDPQKRVTDTVMEPISSEAKASSDKRARSPKFEFRCPEGVDAMDWSALIDNRKAKRAALSEGAHRQIINKLDRWNRDGWPPGPIVAHAAERGWTTVFETDEMKGQGHGNDRQGSSQRDRGRVDGFTAALRKVANRETDYPFARNG